VRYHYTPIPDENTIRLLSLEPAVNGPLACRMSFVRLGDKPTYQALSYVWGDPTKRRWIQCDGRWLLIPTSLAVALRRLRNKETARVLWADAICINQQDIPERNKQVALMAKIYRIAEKVIAWLGDDYGNAKTLFDFVCKLQQLWPHDIHKLVPQLESDHPIFQHRAGWKALGKLFEHVYFKRGWIQQEIGLAKEAIICWGNSEVPWNLICRMNYNFLTAHFDIIDERFDVNSTAAKNTDLLYSTQERYQRVTNSECKTSGETPMKKNFWSILRISRNLRFSDHHDVVYAFLGHPAAEALSGPDKAPLVPIDYSKDVYQLYTELAVKGLMEFQNPLVLSLVNHSGESPNPKLPSWAHDLSPGNNDYVGYNVERFSAGTDTPMTLSINECNTRLTVRGFSFDTVAECQPKFRRLNNNLGVSFLNKHIYEKSVFETIKFISAAPKNAVYKDMSPECIASIILVCGNLDTPQKYLAWYHAFRAQLGLKSDTTKVDSNAEGKFSSHLWIGNGRRVFRTQTGYFGLGPLVMQPGDLVCVLFGFYTPFVLRKVDGHYLFMGDCYVPGLMKGEGLRKWKEGGVEEVDIEIY